MTPLVTVTPRLEPEFRADFFGQAQGNGTRIDNLGGNKGLELITSYDTELILGVSSIQDAALGQRQLR